LNALGVLARDRGDYALAQDRFEKSLSRWRLLPDRLAIARCLHNLANAVRVRGSYAHAQSALREATEIFERVGDRSGAAWSINQQGDIACEQGDLAGAQKFYEQALSAFREAGDRWGSARSLTDLGAIYREQGSHPTSHAAYRDALQIFAELGHRRGMARVWEGCACLALAQGHPARALRLAAAAARLRQSINAPLPQAERSKLEQSLSLAWESLSPVEGKRAWEDGAAMSLEKAVEYSLEEPDPATSG
jgi:tetratricopeptide (TPR) repeat protein